MRSELRPEIAKSSSTTSPLRRALADFLALPALVIAVLLALAGVALLLDGVEPGFVAALRSSLTGTVFPDADATKVLLETVTTVLFTITSITFSLSLIAVQQAAATLTQQVVDQYLERRTNQLVFGYFVGASLVSLVVLVSVHQGFNPVLGAALAVFLASLALVALIPLIYETLAQMRPANIVHVMRVRAVTAGLREADMLARTRRHPEVHPPARIVTVQASEDGFVGPIDLDRLAEIAGDEGEVVLTIVVGSYVTFGEPIATIRSFRPIPEGAAAEVRASINLDTLANPQVDPRANIAELATIGWTSISTAKQNPAAGRYVILALRDLAGRWLGEVRRSTRTRHDGGEVARLPVVYEDRLADELLSALELLAVVASESLQVQNAGEVLQTLALLLPQIQDEPIRTMVVRTVGSVVSTLGDHVLTRALDGELATLAQALGELAPSVAAEVRAARFSLQQTVGELNSRSTRVSGGPSDDEGRS